MEELINNLKLSKRTKYHKKNINNQLKYLVKIYQLAKTQNVNQASKFKIIFNSPKNNQ